MDNRTHIIFKYKCYINKVDNKLYIITESQNITFLKYLEGIFMEFFNYYKSMIIAVLEIKKSIKDMKEQLELLLPDIQEKAYEVIDNIKFL